MKHIHGGFYSYHKSKKRSNKTVSALKTTNGQMSAGPKETADILVKTFAAVFRREAALDENCLLVNVSEGIGEFTVKRQDVLKQLQSLNTSKAADSGIHSRILRNLAESNSFIDAVTILFQAIAHTRCIPGKWKQAIIIALHRKGPTNDAANYRPISLTCILCKVFDKLLYGHLYSNVQKHLSTRQHGFVHAVQVVSLEFS